MFHFHSIAIRANISDEATHTSDEQKNNAENNAKKKKKKKDNH